MVVVKSNMTAYFDVDETLILWGTGEGSALEICGQPCTPHHKHIQRLIEHKARGHTVVVWSAGGYEWAEKAVEILGLEDLVDVVMCKPQWYYDDLAGSEILPDSKRVYVQPMIGQGPIFG